MAIAPPRRGRPTASRMMNSGGEMASRRRVQLAAAVCFFLSLLYFGSSCVRSFREGGSSAAVGSPFKGALLRPGAVPPALVSEGRFFDGTGLPPDAADRPHYDLVVAVLVVGGDSQASQDEIARVRRVYSRYSNQVVPDGGSAKPLSLRVVFVVGRAELPENVMLPDTGLLLGDFFHLDVREGYRHLSDKTKALMGLSAHLSFRFLAKTDGDTFPCLSRVTQKLIELPLDEQPRVYAGLLATCGKVFPVGHKLHDPEFLKATGGVLDCHPMYHQGAFYVLGEKIVQHLARSRDLLTVMSVEDAMVGVWLLGIDKVVLDIGGQFYCQCFTHPVPAQKQSFYHFCKTEEKIDGCMTKFGAC